MSRWRSRCTAFAAAGALLLLAASGGGAYAAISAGAACPAGKPSSDGSALAPTGHGKISCVLTDRDSVAWRYQGDTLYHNSGRGWVATARTPRFQINDGGNAMIEAVCPRAGYRLWLTNSYVGFVPALPPPRRLAANPFIDKTQGRAYPSLYALMNSGKVRKGDHIEIPSLPAGLPIWWTASRISMSDITVSLAPHAIIGCTVDEGNAILPFDTGNGPVTGVTIRGGEIAYAIDESSGQYRGINIGHATDTTIEGVYLHDNDFGIQSGGNNGRVTLTDVKLDHNGSGRNAATTHNIYMGYDGDLADSSHYVIRGGYSVCTDHGGFQVKLRGPSGVIEDYTAAEPSRHGYTNCTESAAVDLSCGGVYKLGGRGAANGVVLELGPKAQNKGIVRYDQEAKTRNCPPGGWRKSALLIQNCWLISDAPFKTVAVANAASPGVKVTVKDCKIVGNNKWTLALGAHVTDGGGNKFYSNRIEAGLPSYPALPPPP